MTRMSRFLSRLLGLVLLVWLSSAGVAAADEARIAVSSASDRQVLILLRLPPQHFRTTGYADSYGDGASRAARRKVAARLARAHGLTLVEDWPMPLVGVDCYVAKVPDGVSPEAVAAQLSRDRAVEWSEPMRVYAARASAPNDPLYRVQPVAREWRLEALHDLATGRNVKVAVIDSAVDPAHPDLAGQVELRQDFVTGRPAAAEAHGTGVAGIIAAIQGNQIGIAGVAPGARLMALRACWQQDLSATLCDTLSLAKAMHYAVDHQAQVINLSLAGPPAPLLSRLIDVALSRGVVVVGAVDPNLAGGGFPASHRGVVAVTLGGAAAPGTFAAPGRDVPTTQPGGKWGMVNGSSYSAAHVSGLYALLREHSPRGRRAPALVASGGAIDACATLRRGPCAAVRPVAQTALPRR